MMKRLFSLAIVLIFGFVTYSRAQQRTNQNPFRPLVDELPSPNSYRTASGRPGPDYFQQQVDYDMHVTLDESHKKVQGAATITYHNNAPESLHYLWLQVDQNVREQHSFGDQIATGKMSKHLSKAMLEKRDNAFDGGFKIASVKDMHGNDLKTYKNHTIMKVILPQPLASGEETKFNIKWHYKLNNIRKMWGRSGYEPLPEKDENIFAIAQFYPRLCVYNDKGWQTKQFVEAEFALEFGNYNVAITVPADHIVAATGQLENPKKVLSSKIRSRLHQAQDSDEPVTIVSEDDAQGKSLSEEEPSKTWNFSAKNVRDFAFASSRKFIWDAMNVKFPDNDVLAMSFYTKEGEPLWNRYSTIAIAHTLKTYSKFTFDYPYPTAISVSVDAIGGGMEYPMISFNGGLPNADGTYSKADKKWVIGTVIHEVGHNYFPMIVNTDERQWFWMDEGFNIFLQGVAERRWDSTWTWSGRPVEMKGYMDDDKSKLVPIMTQADALLQSGMNAYRKPAVGLNILRETILGRDLFDQAFKIYAQTWEFKHPRPEDFFRIMEDASGVDFDWFWRGWFFTTKYVDLAVDDVKVFEPVGSVDKARQIAKKQKSGQPNPEPLLI